jgi:hypothetical protein
MMTHNAIPHTHHNHEQIVEKSHEDSHHTHDHGHHHSHSNSDNEKTVIKKLDGSTSIFDFSHHEHTFHVHSFKDYLLNKNNRIEVENLSIVCCFYSDLNETTQALNYILEEHFPNKHRKPDPPPSFSFSLRGPPMLG